MLRRARMLIKLLSVGRVLCLEIRPIMYGLWPWVRGKAFGFRSEGMDSGFQMYGCYDILP
jgi:hypothetical protein